jgi:hypothetical protein
MMNSGIEKSLKQGEKKKTTKQSIDINYSPTESDKAAINDQESSEMTREGESLPEEEEFVDSEGEEDSEDEESDSYLKRPPTPDNDESYEEDFHDAASSNPRDNLNRNKRFIGTYKNSPDIGPVKVYTPARDYFEKEARKKKSDYKPTRFEVKATQKSIRSSSEESSIPTGTGSLSMENSKELREQIEYEAELKLQYELENMENLRVSSPAKNSSELLTNRLKEAVTAVENIEARNKFGLRMKVLYFVKNSGETLSEFYNEMHMTHDGCKCISCKVKLFSGEKHWGTRVDKTLPWKWVCSECMSYLIYYVYNKLFS